MKCIEGWEEERKERGRSKERRSYVSIVQCCGSACRKCQAALVKVGKVIGWEFYRMYFLNGSGWFCDLVCGLVSLSGNVLFTCWHTAMFQRVPTSNYRVSPRDLRACIAWKHSVLISTHCLAVLVLISYSLETSSLAVSPALVSSWWPASMTTPLSTAWLLNVFYLNSLYLALLFCSCTIAAISGWQTKSGGNANVGKIIRISLQMYFQLFKYDFERSCRHYWREGS